MRVSPSLLSPTTPPPPPPPPPPLAEIYKEQKIRRGREGG